MKGCQPLKIFIYIVLLQLTLPAQFPYSDFEIVESIPLETTLDNPEIRNTDDVWLAMISGAKQTIDIEQFYVSNQENGALEPVIRALERASRRGVAIRIIADSRMANTYPETLERLDRHKNIGVRKLAVFNAGGGVQHSKFFIVDRTQVFLGSQNFDWRALAHIHEIGLRIRQPQYAEQMTRLFELDWQQAEDNQLCSMKPAQQPQWVEMPVEPEHTLRFFTTASPFGNIPPAFTADLSALLGLIDGAENRVWVQLLSYSPSSRKAWFGDLDSALRRAAQRGVDVRLLCSDWCQHRYEMPYLQQLVTLDNLDVQLSTIPEYSGGYIPFARVEHCKMMIVDDRLSWVGSSNWKRDYFYQSRNVAVIIEDQQVNTTLARIFLKSWDGPYAWRIDPEKEYNPKFYGEKD